MESKGVVTCFKRSVHKDNDLLIFRSTLVITLNNINKNDT